MRTSGATAAVAALAAPLLLAGVLGGPGTAQAATAGCRSWTGAQPPSPGPNTQLAGVTVLSACDAWAAGSFVGTGGVRDTLIEHWNGANWTVVPSPSPGSKQNFLTSIRAASPASIWAAGAYDDGHGPSDKTLILHWDGARWTQQRTPNPGSADDELAGVRSISAREAWAVGSSFDGTTNKSLVLHFTGGQWHQVKVPVVLTGDVLDGVAASSATDVWAVGEAFRAKPSVRGGRPPSPKTGSISPTATLILHWNGKTWTHVPSPSPATQSALFAVGVGSRSSALAVGLAESTGGDEHALALRWNGRTWSQVAVPVPGGPASFSVLNGVTVTAQGTAWAAGDAGSDIERPLMERWDGSRWTPVPVPDPGTGTQLLAIAASSGTSAWAVGEAGDPANVASSRAYALHCC
jgi:hypothetical protein